MKRLEAIVYGYVQGVSFRYYTQREARRLGVSGWVANQRDRTVKVVAEGSQEAVSDLLDWLYAGPPTARVDKVDVTWGRARGEFRRFEIRFL